MYDPTPVLTAPEYATVALGVLAEHDHYASAVPESVELTVFFVVGVLAGAHCLGMCGPLVTAYSDRFAASEKRRADSLTVYEVRQHGLFNLGRAASYALIGGLFGLLGGLAFTSVDAVSAAGDAVRGGVGILVGLAIVASGLYYLTGRPGIPHDLPLVGPLFQRVSGLIAGRIHRLANSPGIVGLGAIHGILPCPIIYPAYLYAFTIGDPVRGAMALGVLGVGTIPALFLFGTVLGSVSLRTRIRLHRALGVGFVVLGYIPLQHGLLLYGIELPGLHLPFVPLG